MKYANSFALFPKNDAEKCYLSWISAMGTNFRVANDTLYVLTINLLQHRICL